MTRFDGSLLRSAVLHPAARSLPSDPDGPARVRQLAGSGPTAVMKSTWRDPTDLTPNASKRPRQLVGYRTYCPLRRMAMKSGSQVTVQHIAAADLLRLQVDMAVIGASGCREAINAAHGPRSGPSDAALSQVYATVSAQRALARLSATGRAMATVIILGNRSLYAWCAGETARLGREVDRGVEMGRLLSVLDILADHYGTEIEQAMKTRA